MAYFSCTVGAGFASGQEMLQYYAAFGWWGVIGAVIALVLMPLAAMIAMQYGSYFQATSHDRVFSSIAGKFLARFVDYSITFTQFCISFVMLTGAGANLNQQFGLPLWVGSTLMAVAVIICGMMNVEKVTNTLGSITPFVVALLVIAAVYSFMNAPSDLAAVGQFGIDNVETTLPNWWVSTFNYVGIAMMGGVSMGIIMGGDTVDVRTAGRGGIIHGLLFGVLLVMMVVAMIFNVTHVYEDALPTLSIITNVNDALGLFASIVIVGYILSFLDFATLVGAVFPIMGYVALVMIGVLIFTWLARGRGIITAESRRRDKIRSLVLRMIDPKQKFSNAQRAELSQEIFHSNLASQPLRESVPQEVIAELDADSSNPFSAADYEVDEDWLEGRYEPIHRGQVRYVSEAEPTGYDADGNPIAASEKTASDAEATSTTRPRKATDQDS
ncbi:hypothetical protein [Corynebacterium sp. HMSC04H06]|uniref:YkvI family membrane protein n=1 Tax=Corynebacterium sp. HMSC04H06 TaxID=1581050 RepID=UPI0008A2D090|nr:hypothetical protein [Corynebacterium sp. HMSC04H06]